jgi:uncharacterized membrane protein
MQQWKELEAVATNIIFSNSSDALIWHYEIKGVYSTSSLYCIINFGVVQPIYIPVVWQLHVPPCIYNFISLLAHKKLMTRDNLK